MFKEIRTTKEGAETIQEILALLNIPSHITVVGKSARMVSFVYDKSAIKAKLTRSAGRKPTGNLGDIDLYLEVKKLGIKAVSEKLGISERAVYKRLEKYPKYIKEKSVKTSDELVQRPGETGRLKYSPADKLYQIMYADGAHGLCITALDNFRIQEHGRWVEASIEKNKAGKWVLVGREHVELEGLEILVVD